MTWIDMRDNVYDIFTRQTVFTRDDLIKEGLKEENIDFLLRDGFIIPKENDTYTIAIDRAFLNYARTLENTRGKGHTKKATECYKRFVEVHPDNYEANFALFRFAVKANDFADAYLYLEKLKNHPDEFPIFEYNFCLFLLNFIIELPSVSKAEVENMSLDDICAPEAYLRDNDIITSTNSLRVTVFKGNLGFARMKCERNLYKFNHIVVPSTTIKKLVSTAQSRQNYYSYHPEETINMVVPKNYIIRRLRDGFKGFANHLISMYLRRTGREEYEYLIASLITISLLERDAEFTKVDEALTSIKDGTFSFDTSTYVTNLERSLANGDLVMTNVYLEALIEAYQKGHTDIRVEELTDYLKRLNEQLTVKGKPQVAYTIKPQAKKTDTEN